MIVQNKQHFIDTVAQALIGKEVIDIFCVGTPTIVGDLYGPVVGANLQRLVKGNVRVIGSVVKPVTTSTYLSMLDNLRDDAFVIAVDVLVADSTEYVGKFVIRNAPLSPGAALDRTLPSVGDLTIGYYAGTTLESLMKCSVDDVLRAANTTSEVIRDAVLLAKLQSQ